MTPFQLHDTAVSEINAYYAFILRVQILNQFRLLNLGLSLKYLRTMGFSIWGAFTVPVTRQRVLDLLCSQKEKDHLFYSIAVHRHPTHALAEYLANKLPQSNWRDLFHVHDVREDAIPGFQMSKHVLPYLVLIVSLFGVMIGAGGELSADDLVAWVKPASWIEKPQYLLSAVAVLYIVTIIFSVSLRLWTTRHRARRAGNILKYMAVIYDGQHT